MSTAPRRSISRHFLHTPIGRTYLHHCRPPYERYHSCHSTSPSDFAALLKLTNSFKGLYISQRPQHSPSQTKSHSRSIGNVRILLSTDFFAGRRGLCLHSGICVADHAASNNLPGVPSAVLDSVYSSTRLLQPFSPAIPTATTISAHTSSAISADDGPALDAAEHAFELRFRGPNHSTIPSIPGNFQHAHRDDHGNFISHAHGISISWARKPTKSLASNILRVQRELRIGRLAQCIA